MESVRYYIQEGILYEPVIPDIHDWPIARLFRKKQRFLQEVIGESTSQLAEFAAREGMTISDLIERTMYLERIRMTEEPWKVDPRDEKPFWSQMKKQLVRNEQESISADLLNLRTQEMLESIVERYANEIVSTFKPNSYHFAKRFLPVLFSTLLNASAGKTLRSMVNHNVQLQERILLAGETEAIRSLTKHGTIVLAPTHLSNMDSILVGWGLHALGLPAFTYGAGLNLFNTPILPHFMMRLGAYKVDRRKKNPIYRSTLDAYSTINLVEGVHSLFFPGGTRSRSGAIEKKVKLGLLGTAVEAQRRNFRDGPRSGSGKIFVVPLVMSYHFVLEAASLINQHLKYTGQEQYYLANDDFANYRKFLKFVWTTFSKSSDIVLSFGKPMDIFGNFVDNQGNSYDTQGRPVDIRQYFMSQGEVREDAQRDAEYTRMLGEKIVERYHIEHHVFSSHVVAFVAFQMLKREYKQFDLYGLLRLPEEERVLEIPAFKETLERVLYRLNELASAGKVHLSRHMINDTTGIFEHGIKNLGIYHAQRPLRIQDEKHLVSNNMNLLYYYHNRLTGYGLEKYI
ncbi:MAG: glycerol-3-phosphate acyltransferase [Bacteroidetes bacterium]|nr:MAG: glycerol-3-phosphate acyltransferase [Bacteroidota bacterium]